MFDPYILLKLAHILSSTILFGTGIGTAFHGLVNGLRGGVDAHIQTKAIAWRTVVWADWCFTTPAVIIQPLTGIALIHLAGWDWHESWLVLSIILYVIAGLCWLPVVGIQLRLTHMAEDASATGQSLPSAYRRLFWIWFTLGWPAFICLIGVFYLMVAKPTLW